MVSSTIEFILKQEMKAIKIVNVVEWESGHCRHSSIHGCYHPGASISQTQSMSEISDP